MIHDWRNEFAKKNSIMSDAHQRSFSLNTVDTMVPFVSQFLGSSVQHEYNLEQVRQAAAPNLCLPGPDGWAVYSDIQSQVG
ncbi:hypothetical protein C0Q70_21542 [Pomacea canaliculata]|uniref:Uncharacterized protein n=1 Tax=Pomacea canaliculata TaxID=400727 RepID=A0A2T7NCT5_POMCA|nr:hypothetical protein C0Q70_21542 [Pomacea canaliculata]